MKPSKIYLKIFFSFLLILIVAEVFIFVLFGIIVGRHIGSEVDRYASAQVMMVKEIIESQDQDFQIKIPEFSKEFDQTFQNMIGDRKQQHQDLEQKTQESLESLIVSWNKQMSSGKEKLVDVSTQLDKAIGNNLENLRVILDSNIESTLKQINTIYHIEDSKDIFGLKEIQATIKQTSFIPTLYHSTIIFLHSKISDSSVDEQLYVLLNSGINETAFFVIKNPSEKLLPN